MVVPWVVGVGLATSWGTGMGPSPGVVAPVLGVFECYSSRGASDGPVLIAAC